MVKTEQTGQGVPELYGSRASVLSLLMLSANNHPVYCGPPVTADSANAAIWAGTENTADFSLVQSDTRLTDFEGVCDRQTASVKEDQVLKTAYPPVWLAKGL